MRQIFNTVDKKVVLGNRHCNTSDIYFLKGISTNQAICYIRCNGNHRNTVHKRSCNSRHQIGCSGTACGKHHAGFSRRSCISVCRMCCSLFMGCQHVPNSVLIGIQCVINVQRSASGISKNGVHALFQQNFHDHLRSCHLHVAVPLFLFFFRVFPLFICTFFDTPHYITLLLNVNNFFWCICIIKKIQCIYKNALDKLFLF